MVDNKAEYEELLSRDSLDSSDGVEPASLDAIAEVSQRTKTHRWSFLSPKSKSNPSDSHVSERISPLLLWLAAAISLITLTDLLALAYSARLFRTVFQDKAFASTLEYASPYIGLKELYASGTVNASAVAPILVRPRVSAQVFPDEPERRAPRGEHDYWSPTWGTLSPNERHLHVSPKIHTIVQFRAIDFGMEDCHLVLTLPGAAAAAPLDSEEHGAAAFALHPASRFDVFRLAAERPLDVQTLSFRTKPRVARKVATVRVREGERETLVHRFPCAWSSLHVFEVACAEGGGECLLDVWSGQNTTYGVNIYQHQTI